MKHGMLIVLGAGLVAMGCGPSPALQNRPVQMVPVPASEAPEGCACDDDDVDPAAQPKSVQYVPIEDWTPPPSVQRVEEKIRARGPAPPNYSKMPALTLHQPIPPTQFYGRRSYYYR